MQSSNNELILKANINGESINDSESIIKVKSQREISENLFKELIDLSTKSCLEGEIDLELNSRIDLPGTDGSIIVDNTKENRQQQYKHDKNAECLRVQAGR